MEKWDGKADGRPRLDTRLSEVFVIWMIAEKHKTRRVCLVRIGTEREDKGLVWNFGAGTLPLRGK